ncbi:MAG: hypothetical protein ABIR83_16880 [Nakamurella sp.]
MPSHPLGTGDSVRLIAGQRVWDALTPALAGRSSVIAAVASIGRDADRLLPLSRGATLVVNASDAAVRQGTTDPEVLLRWHRAGVRVHSLDSLNATLILVDTSAPFVAAGSADASQISAQHLDEAVMVTDLPDTIIAARITLGGFVARSGTPLTEDQLLEAITVFGADRVGPPDVETEVPESSVSEAVVESAAPDDTAATDDSADADVEADVEAPAAAVDPTDDLGPADSQDEQDDQDGPLAIFPWARPHTVGLAQIVDQPAVMSEDAQLELERLNLEYGLRAASFRAVRRPGAFSIDVVQIRERSDQPRPFGTQHRTGTHVIAVEAPAEAKRPRTVGAVHPPGRVISQLRDELSYPRSHYYFLLVRHAGPPRVYKDVVHALKAVGETVNFDRSYMVQAKIEALLALWPEAVYD